MNLGPATSLLDRGRKGVCLQTREAASKGGFGKAIELGCELEEFAADNPGKSQKTADHQDQGTRLGRGG